MCPQVTVVLHYQHCPYAMTLSEKVGQLYTYKSRYYALSLSLIFSMSWVLSVTTLCFATVLDFCWAVWCFTERCTVLGSFLHTSSVMCSRKEALPSTLMLIVVDITPPILHNVITFTCSSFHVALCFSLAQYPKWTCQCFTCWWLYPDLRACTNSIILDTPKMRMGCCKCRIFKPSSHQ